MMDSFPSSAFHGFRVGPPCGRAAPPVATTRRPVGANGLKPFVLRPVRKMVLSPDTKPSLKGSHGKAQGNALGKRGPS